MGSLRDKFHMVDVPTATCDEPGLSGELIEKLDFYILQVRLLSPGRKESCTEHEHWVTSEGLYRGIYCDMCKEILVHLKF